MCDLLHAVETGDSRDCRFWESASFVVTSGTAICEKSAHPPYKLPGQYISSEWAPLSGAGMLHCTDFVTKSRAKLCEVHFKVACMMPWPLLALCIMMSGAQPTIHALLMLLLLVAHLPVVSF